MTVYTLGPSDAKIFSFVLTNESRQWLGSREVISLGAFYEGLPAGILQFYLDYDGNAVVIYFSAFHAFDKDEIGRFLFEQMKDLLRKSGSGHAGILFTDSAKEKEMSSILKKAGFKKDAPEDIFLAPLKVWLDCPKQVKECKTGNITAFAEVPTRSRRKVMTDVFGEDARAIEMTGNTDGYEEHVSCFLEDSDGKACLVAVMHVDHIIEIIRIGHTGESTAGLLPLLSHALVSAAEEYKANLTVTLRCDSEADKAFLSATWPKASKYEAAYYRCMLQD